MIIVATNLISFGSVVVYHCYPQVPFFSTLVSSCQSTGLQILWQVSWYPIYLEIIQKMGYIVKYSNFSLQIFQLFLFSTGRGEEMQHREILSVSIIKLWTHYGWVLCSSFWTFGAEEGVNRQGGQTHKDGLTPVMVFISRNPVPCLNSFSPPFP